MVCRSIRPVKEFVQARGTGAAFHRAAGSDGEIPPDLDVFRFVRRG
jgi:hypothetical protein